MALYPTVTAGVRDDRAIYGTRPVVDILGEKPPVRWPIEMTIVRPGASSDDLMNFAKQLDEGKYHLGVVFGIEYGWMREKFPRLQPLVLFSVGDATIVSSILVKDPQIKGVADLKGRKLARYGSMALNDYLFLDQTIAQLGEDPQSFFGSVYAANTAEDALKAVHAGEADFVVVGSHIHHRWVVNSQIKLQTLQSSKTWPRVTLTGVPEHMNAVRPGMWQAMQKGFLALHEDREAKHLTRLWRMDRFLEPDKKFLDLVSERTQEFKLSDLGPLAGYR